MSNQGFSDKTLAQAWILPLIIASGLASAYAIPWNYQNVSAFAIATTILPLISQFVLACLTSVFAFLGKQVWLSLLIATVAVSALNSISFGLDFWGVGLPRLPKILILLTSLSLIPTLIWGRKRAKYSPPNSVTFDSSGDASEW